MITPVHATSFAAPAQKVLGKFPRLSQSSFRQAVSETIRAEQDDLSDDEFGDELGVSGQTIGNARNRQNNLGAMAILRMGQRRGVQSLNTILSLIGARAVATSEVTVDVGGIPCEVARHLPLIIDLLRDGVDSDADIRKLDQEGVIDTFVRLAARWEQRRDALRLSGSEQ